MLENTICLLFLYLFCALVAKVDRFYFGTYWTPTPLLLVPFTCVASVHFLLGGLLGFAPLAPEVIAVWIVGSFVFWLAGHGLRQIWLGGKPMDVPVDLSPDEHIQNRVTVWSMFGGLVSIVLLIHAVGYLLKLGGLSAIASQTFQDQWGAGWPAHVRTALEVVIIMVLGSAKRWSVSVVVNLALMLLVILLYQSKGALLAPLIAGSVFRVLSGTFVPRVRHFVVAAVASFFVFQLVYLVGWAALDPSSLLKADVYAFFSLHFMSYLFSGILGFSESLRLGVTWLDAGGMVLFAPFFNLFAVVFDFPLVMVAELAQDHYVQIAEHGGRSNVNTFFGTIVLAVGPLYGVIVVSVVSFISHAMFIGWVRHPNRWLLVAYCYWGSLLIFAWFEYYFWLLRCIEVPMICLMIAMIEEYLLPHGQKKIRRAS